MWSAKLILISCISLVASRPQNQDKIVTRASGPEPQVEIERQLIHEVIPLGDLQVPPSPISGRKTEDQTREILEKIAELNKKQGLVQKKLKPNYFHFPFSYSRSQEGEARSNNFKFARDPFTNPILDYLEKEEPSNNNKNVATFRKPNFDSEQYPDALGVSVTDTDPEIAPEDNVPGQYIKRKITHYQTIMMPNPYMAPLPASEPGIYQNPQYPSAPLANNGYPLYMPNIMPTQNNNKTSLESQTVDHIRNIVSRGQVNPMYSYQAPPNFQTMNPQQQFYPGLPIMAPNPYLLNNPNKQARQNWNWPGAGLFPIYIRDPFLQMYYAVTNMVEYGQSAGSGGPCKLTPRPQGSRVKINSKATQDVKDNDHQVTLEINKKDGIDVEIKESSLADNIRYLDVEDIDVGDDDLVKFTINMPKSTISEAREFKGDSKSEKTGWGEFIKLRNDSFLSHIASGKLESSFESKQEPPVLHVEELEDEPVESEKAEDINVSNQGSKKVFSKDNTGNGIFIQKLKVRKGGVAIAGPGGIATAGSGGTAIVGPNGVAYTHPDGLAIAGSGTKVIAVDPSVDLNEVIKDSVLNGTRHVPNTRVGKVVAIGPVVYYNRGSSNTSPPAWLPLAFLPTQGQSNFYSPSTSFQFYRFPRYHAQSDIKTQRDYRRLLKSLALDEPRNFFSSTKQEIRLGEKPDNNNKPPSLAPYRLNPLFNFIQNKNTIEQDKVIRFRASNSINDDITTLILKPQSTAVAGVEGKAVSNPLSRAILREGTNVDILFEPAAVAIAGPGGIAHAQSDLEISYEYL